MPLTDLAIIAAGFIVLSLSAEEAIRRLLNIARHFEVTEFAISFVLVGIVAVFPELSIGVNSALEGVPSFGLGIVLSSNIADLTLVLGTVAILGGGIKPGKPVMRRAKWFLLASLLPVILMLDGELSQLDGLVLLGAFFAYVIKLLQMRPARRKADGHRISLPVELAVLSACLALLLGSGHVITDAARTLSTELSMPLFFIGTILAFGTCLPELTLAVKAARSRHSDLGFGNVLGNVIADCMGTLGVIAIIAPIRPAYPQLALISGGFMAVSMAAVVLMLSKKGGMGRRDGVILVVMYVLFMAAQTLAESALVSAGI